MVQNWFGRVVWEIRCFRAFRNGGGSIFTFILYLDVFGASFSILSKAFYFVLEKSFLYLGKFGCLYGIACVRHPHDAGIDIVSFLWIFYVVEVCFDCGF